MMVVSFEMNGDIAMVTLDDPGRRNALSFGIVEGALAGLREAREKQARAIVVAAKGPAFCAGADIAALLDGGWMDAPPTRLDPVDLFKALDAESRPVIAAVGGPALGGGFELTLCCDLVVAAPEAWFAVPEIGHGVIPNTALSRLARVIGLRRALELVLTRRRLGSREALSLGLVNSIVPRAALLDAALALAREIVAGASPGAIAAVKESARRHYPTDWTEVRDSLARIPPEEWREGLAAFLERRAPDYERFWRKE
jgi:enoyl-CoA hydratase